MLPIGTGTGTIWQAGTQRCAVGYEISAPLRLADGTQIQRINLDVPSADIPFLLATYGLTLVLADGHRQALPRPYHDRNAVMQCYVSTYM